MRMSRVVCRCRVIHTTTRLIIRPSAGACLNVVDLYDSATGTWSTARLSVARSRLAATSVGNMALFAGGDTGWERTGSALLCEGLGMRTVSRAF